MTKIIPLSSLVVLVGPSGAGKSTLAKTHFPHNEIVSSDAIRTELLGDHRRQDAEDEVMDEFLRRIEWRLKQGFRAVADATHIHDGKRIRTAKLGLKYGVPVIYLVYDRSYAAKVGARGWRPERLIESHGTTFDANEKKILSGDRGDHRVKVDTVVDARTDSFVVVNHLTRDPEQVLSELTDRGFNRIRFIGDVHGNRKGYEQAVNASRGTYLQFLGDVPDYGVDTIWTTEQVAKRVRDGEASNIFGNHEHKVMRFIVKERQAIENRLIKIMVDDGQEVEVIEPNPDFPGYKGTASHGNAVTFNQIKAMDPVSRLHFETRYRGLVENTPTHMVITAENGKFGLVHGAMRAKLFDEDVFRLTEDVNGRDWDLAMFGQTVKGETIISSHDGRTYPKRFYGWVDDLPARHTVIVGHDVRSREAPLVQTNSNGGRAIFMDTGSSKGGIVSWMDMEIEKRKSGFYLTEVGFGSEQ